MNIKLTTACVALVGLTACESAVAPTQGIVEYNAARVSYATLRTEPLALPNTPPTGSFTYDGKFTSNATINDEGGYSIIGDVAMTVGFLTDNRVTGQITDINLIDRATPESNQRFTAGDGTTDAAVLNITGSYGGTTISATAAGEMGAVLTSSAFESQTRMNMQLDGNVRTDTSVSDTITGTATGTGTPINGVNGMRVNITGGQFYAQN